MHVLRIDSSNAWRADVGCISRVVNDCVDSCHGYLYLASLHQCDPVGMGVKKSQTTKGLPYTAVLEKVSMSENEQAMRNPAEVYEEFFVPALLKD